jgi:uncharacterized protein YjiS (DUF1127 family)
MSLFNFTAATLVSAFCHAMSTAWKSDRRAARRRRKSIAAFNALDDRTLMDIGVSRCEIRELVDAQIRFEAEAVAAKAPPSAIRNILGDALLRIGPVYSLTPASRPSPSA